MPAQITSDLKSVLDTRNPQRVDVIIEASPGEGDAVRDLLSDTGLDFTAINVGRKAVFEATVTPNQISRIQQSDAVAVIDHSPTFAPTGAIRPPQPGRGESFPAQDITYLDQKDISEQLGIEDAWELAGTRGEGVKIGMVDTPVDQNHPSLDGKIEERGGPKQPDTHGTWVASQLVAEEYDTDTGIIRGVAPEAELYAHGALAGGGASVLTIAEGVEYLRQNDVDIINLSLGGPHSEVLHNVIREAKEDGILVVSSAGNSGPGQSTISCPAHHNESLTVGSVGSSGGVAAFSSRGPGYPDAPDKPDVMAFGGDARMEDGQLAVTEAVIGADTNGRDVYLLGTSMAGPQAAGMAALRLSALRNGGQ